MNIITITLYNLRTERYPTLSLLATSFLGTPDSSIPIALERMANP